MKRLSIQVATFFFMTMSACVMATPTIELDGHHLTIEKAWAIAHQKAQVAIAPQALERLRKSHALVMAAAQEGKAVYGLTVGVGLNKDQKLFKANGQLSDEVLKASRDFNLNALQSHSAGVGPMMPDTLVRLSMVIRLNTLLTGASGAQAEVAQRYARFLNAGLTPQIPAKGSVGEADILLASHVGAVMIGRWQASYQGVVLPAKEALKRAGIAPLVPEGKDALAILSNNSVAVAYALAGLQSSEKILAVTPLVYGLSLEGLNGNLAPILAPTLDAHPYPGLAQAGQSLRQALAGSYLWNQDPQRALQDPLSYRVTVYAYSEAQRATEDLKALLTTQINSSDDNPATLLEAPRDGSASSYVDSFYIQTPTVSGAIIPSANFNPLPLALAVQRVTLAMGHLSHVSVQRTLHLSDDHFTGLTRFLADPANKGHAFGAIQKAFMGLHAENVALTQPVSLYGMPVAGDIEDTFTNLLQASQRLGALNENLMQIYSLELLHATQAIDLRRRLKAPDLKLSTPTKSLYRAYRQKVPYVARDRVFTNDIEKGVEVLNTYP